MQPRAVELVDPDDLRIEWKDGRQSHLRARPLRLACPCAGCIEEGSGRPLLDPASVPVRIALMAVEPVGRYALHFTFSDGHHTGIFSFALLRSLADAEAADA